MANNHNNLMKRARWDRLLGALVVLVILIVVIVSLAKSCGKNKTGDTPATGESTTSIIDVAETTQPATKSIKLDNSKAIYLSPSTETGNVYACDEEVNEEIVMFEIANQVRALLETDGYTVYMCQESENVREKVTKGNELGCGAYVAIRSDQNVAEVGGQGTECIYNTNISGSRALAENIYNRVAELTPTEDRGLKDETKRELYEIMNNRYPCCAIEIEFHDNEEGSQWILDNEEAVAKAIKDGIVAFMKNNEAGSAPDESAADDSLAEDSDAGEAE